MNGVIARRCAGFLRHASGFGPGSRIEVRVAAPTPESHSPEPMLADICLTWIIAKERT